MQHHACLLLLTKTRALLLLRSWHAQGPSLGHGWLALHQLSVTKPSPSDSGGAAVNRGPSSVTGHAILASAARPPSALGPHERMGECTIGHGAHQAGPLVGGAVCAGARGRGRAQRALR